MGAGRSSSSESDGDAEWRAAIDSVTSAATIIKQESGGRVTREEENGKHEPQNIKHYQIKAQRTLYDILDKTIEVVTDMAHTVEKDPADNDAGVRLFKRAPVGIVFDHVDELQGPNKKPKLLPGEELDEKSKEFRKRLQSTAVDGGDIMAAARVAGQKALVKLEVKEAAAKREEERVAELKRIRGERWLPSIARQMRLTAQCKR
ncbi:hypothetical protein CASFOL_011605 [Castilleja foliolosa]|uniref:Uncharacterized protein n=1 Tax=Castilleja foliolosa TaxID=1961234 RepID=A0ABD3DVZ4_9LAMI